MVIYIASYPRSGNSLIQQLVHDYFGRPVSAVYRGKLAKVNRYADGELPTVTNWLPPDPSAQGRLRAWWNPLPARLASYDLRQPSGECRRQSFLMPGCSDVLTVRNRRKLAEMDSAFFIKTHKPPFSRYISGEFILLPVRHPGAVLSSLRHFMRDHRGKEIPFADVIRGGTPNGSWSDWHRKWLGAINRHAPSHSLILRYEDTVAAPVRACERIEQLLQLPFNRQASLTPFETLHQTAPKHIRCGQASGWEQSYSTDEMRLLLELHGDTWAALEKALADQAS